MTIEEMRDAIREHCHTHSPYCTDNGECPLFNLIDKDSCYECASDEEVIRNYKLCYPNSTDTTDTEDVVNHPNHYTNGGMECIDEMILVFGKKTVAHFCLCNAWKYRYRALFKNGEEDINKSHWYMKKYKELSENV